MTNTEQEWVQSAVECCKKAADKGATILLIRRGADSEDGESDIAVSNTTNPELTRALAYAINGPGGGKPSGELEDFDDE